MSFKKGENEHSLIVKCVNLPKTDGKGVGNWERLIWRRHAVYMERQWRKLGTEGEGQNDVAVVASGYQVKGLLGKVRVDFFLKNIQTHGQKGKEEEGQNDAAIVASGYQVKGLGKVRF